MLIISFGTITGHAQELIIVSFQEFEKVLSTAPEKPKLINFWATWCKPCVEELPYFSAVQQLNDHNLEFVFVSLDFMSQTSKVKELIQKLSLTGTLIQLNATGGDWIDAFDKNWSGAIPYTVLLLPNGEKREHYDAFNNLDDLKLFIDKNLIN
ncbi:MAG: TlpA disulfide reductase family protein [Chitinophagales bacterium]